MAKAGNIYRIPSDRVISYAVSISCRNYGDKDFKTRTYIVKINEDGSNWNREQVKDSLHMYLIKKAMIMCAKDGLEIQFATEIKKIEE